MAQIRLQPILLSFIAFAWIGCATNGPSELSKSGSSNDAYRESTVDVKDRSPASMAVPQEVANGDVIDPVQLRAKADYHFTLADSYSLEGNPQKAIEEYKLTLLFDQKSPVVRLRLASEYVKQGLVSEALEQAKLAVEKDPNYEEGRLLLGGLYSALRMYDEALTQYRAVLKRNSESAEAPMFIGALLAEQKKYSESIAYFEALIKNPKYKSLHLAHYYLGRIRIEEGKKDAKAKAEASFKSALQFKPGFADVVMALGNLYETSGRKNEAKQLYARYQEKHGPDANVAEALSKIYVEAEDFERAYQQFEIVESADQDNLNVKVKMAFILIEGKKYSDAILKLEDILARAPYSDKIRFYLGAVHEEIKDFKTAISHFAKIPAGSQYYSEAVIHSAYLNKMMNDYDEAIRVVKDGIKNQDGHAPFYALYASFLDDQKRYEEGAKMLKAAVEKFPKDAQLHFYLGSMYDRLGKVDETITQMRNVLALNSTHIQAINYLAFTLADHNIDLVEAENLARRAVELQPNDGFIMDTLGWVLYKKGDLAESVRWLEAANKLQPDESVIAEHLGDAYYRSQLPEKAKQMYSRAAETESNPENAKKIRAKMVSIERQNQNADSVQNSRLPASSTKPVVTPKPSSAKK